MIKLNHVSQEVVTEVKDLLMNPSAENLYGVLKETLIERRIWRLGASQLLLQNAAATQCEGRGHTWTHLSLNNYFCSVS